jgi:galactoside O-acetyltransferase
VRSDLIQRLRIAWFRHRWTCAQIEGEPQLRAPALLAGKGSISFGEQVILGWEQSAGYLSGYTYLEARNPESRIVFGDLTHLNNGVMVVSEGPGISIGRRCLFGPGVHVYDSDFHPLAAADRRDSAPQMARVEIGDDVFIGTNALILKGVRVGDGSVVGAGAVVVADVASGAVVGGNPARVIAA